MSGVALSTVKKPTWEDDVRLTGCGFIDRHGILSQSQHPQLLNPSPSRYDIMNQQPHTQTNHSSPPASQGATPGPVKELQQGDKPPPVQQQSLSSGSRLKRRALAPSNRELLAMSSSHDGTTTTTSHADGADSACSPALTWQLLGTTRQGGQAAVQQDGHGGSAGGQDVGAAIRPVMVPAPVPATSQAPGMLALPASQQLLHAQTAPSQGSASLFLAGLAGHLQHTSPMHDAVHAHHPLCNLSSTVQTDAMGMGDGVGAGSQHMAQGKGKRRMSQGLGRGHASLPSVAEYGDELGLGTELPQGEAAHSPNTHHKNGKRSGTAGPCEQTGQGLQTAGWGGGPSSVCQELPVHAPKRLGLPVHEPGAIRNGWSGTAFNQHERDTCAL